MTTTVLCSKCGIKLYEMVLGTGSRKIFRSFATQPDGNCLCINCYEGKNKEVNDGYKTKSSTDDNIL